MTADGNGKSNGKSNGKRTGTAEAKAARRGAASPRRAAPKPEAPAAMAKRTSSNGAAPRGTLIIVGGHEDKEDEKLILRAVAGHAGDGALVVVTVASGLPAELWADYEPLFRGLGVRDVRHFHVESRDEARRPEALATFDGATAVYITGGDQLKLTSQLGDTPVYNRLREIYEGGGLIAGTSAGASVMCETMVVEGGGSESHRIGAALMMAPGFGFIPGVLIDQHFAERGRMGRLIASVTQNPRILGIGIDENTAIVCDPRRCFSVLGAGAVSVLDGRDVTYSNLADEARDRTLSAFNLRLHQLSMGDEFDLETRIATNHPAEEVERELVGAD